MFWEIVIRGAMMAAFFWVGYWIGWRSAKPRYHRPGIYYPVSEDDDDSDTGVRLRGQVPVYTRDDTFAIIGIIEYDLLENERFIEDLREINKRNEGKA